MKQAAIQIIFRLNCTMLNEDCSPSSHQGTTQLKNNLDLRKKNSYEEESIFDFDFFKLQFNAEKEL